MMDSSTEQRELWDRNAARYDGPGDPIMEAEAVWRWNSRSAPGS